MKVVYPAADLVRFNPELLPSTLDCRTALKLPVAGALIGIFGRLQAWKGMHVLIDALPEIRKQYPDTRLLIVGGAWGAEAAYEQQLHERCRALGISEQVIFAGQQKDVPLWMNACDVVVHASNREPFGMVVVEAMALGKPVVAGANGGPGEVITHGITGLLSPFENAAMLSDAVLRFLKDPAFARRVGDAAHERAQYFAIPRFAEGVSSTLMDWMDSAPLPVPTIEAVHAE